MADAADDIRANLEEQIADMKKELSKISKSLAARASDAMDTAEDALDEGRSRARHTVAQVRGQAQAAVGAMRDNPGTTATVLSTVALLGLAAGLLLSGVVHGNHRR